jgi:hypothetical protein
VALALDPAVAIAVPITKRAESRHDAVRLG